MDDFYEMYDFYEVIYTDNDRIQAETLEEAQRLAKVGIYEAAEGEHSTYYEPVEIIKISHGDIIPCELGFDPVIQPEEPQCLYWASQDRRHHWEYDDNKRPHGEGFTWSNTCIKCGLIEWHDTWHDDSYGGILHDWMAYSYRYSDVS
jgi:hypothetical protein